MYQKQYIFFLGPGLRESTKFNVNKFYLVQYPILNNKPGYNVIIDWIHYSPTNTIITKSDYKKTDPIIYHTTEILTRCGIEYDLLSCYHIYNNRLSDKNKTAKNKILAMLALRKLSINTSYYSILAWYMYLRTNLVQFPVKLPKNKYFEHTITLDTDDNIILIEPYAEKEAFMNELTLQCSLLYQQLLKQINRLD